MTVPIGPFCHDCPHAPLGIRFIPPDGAGTSGILLVGDSPWIDEIKEGRPFVGAAGSTLNRMFQLIGMDRGDTMITNTTWCKPKHLRWMDNPRRFPDANAAIEHCRPNLDSLIERMPPKVIVPLGNVALRRVCGVSGIERHAGYVLATPYGVPAVPGYHPSFVQQGNQKLNASCMFVLNRAREIANGTYKPSQYELLLDPPPDDLRAYIRRSCVSGRIPTLIVDIETPESDRIDFDQSICFGIEQEERIAALLK